jgi:hypothetical protein
MEERVDKADRMNRLRAAIAGALSVSAKATDDLSSDVSNHFLMVLKGLAKAVHDHASAILHLSQRQHIRSSKVLLRTLIESWIIASYVAADETSSRADSYIMNELAETKRLLKALLRRATEKPGEERAVLDSAGLTSLDDLKERIAKVGRDLDHAKRDGVSQFPKIAECAKAANLEVTYRSVYGYLLSAQVHARAGDTLRDLRTDSGDRHDDHRVLLTTFFLQVQMLTLMNEHFGRPDRDSLVPLQALLAELQTTDPIL